MQLTNRHLPDCALGNVAEVEDRFVLPARPLGRLRLLLKGGEFSARWSHWLGVGAIGLVD